MPARQDEPGRNEQPGQRPMIEPDDRPELQEESLKLQGDKLQPSGSPEIDTHRVRQEP